MKLFEVFGFARAPIRGKKPGEQNLKVGRPMSSRVKKRPNKTLWFQDDKLWTTDLDLNHGGQYNLVADEEEETVAAVDDDRAQVYGYWDKKKQRGVTFNTPRPIHTVFHPKKSLKDFLTK